MALSRTRIFSFLQLAYCTLSPPKTSWTNSSGYDSVHFATSVRRLGNDATLLCCTGSGMWDRLMLSSTACEASVVRTSTALHHILSERVVCHIQQDSNSGKHHRHQVALSPYLLQSFQDVIRRDFRHRQ